jgi:hypothetical protein
LRRSALRLIYHPPNIIVVETRHTG